MLLRGKGQRRLAGAKIATTTGHQSQGGLLLDQPLAACGKTTPPDHPAGRLVRVLRATLSAMAPSKADGSPDPDLHPPLLGDARLTGRIAPAGPVPGANAETRRVRCPKATVTDVPRSIVRARPNSPREPRDAHLTGLGAARGDELMPAQAQHIRGPRPGRFPATTDPLRRTAVTMDPAWASRPQIGSRAGSLGHSIPR